MGGTVQFSKSFGEVCTRERGRYLMWQSFSGSFSGPTLFAGARPSRVFFLSTFRLLFVVVVVLFLPFLFYHRLKWGFKFIRDSFLKKSKKE